MVPDEFLFIHEVPGDRVLIFQYTFAFGAESYKVVVVLPWDFDSYLMLSLKSDFRRSYMIRGTIFQLIY